MATTATWIVSDLSGPPAHPRLRARYDEARQRGAPARVFVAGPPSHWGGLSSGEGLETVVVGERAWQGRLGADVREGTWDEARQALRLLDGSERDLLGRIHPDPIECLESPAPETSEPPLRAEQAPGRNGPNVEP
jgi:hypothetical protein